MSEEENCQSTEHPGDTAKCRIRKLRAKTTGHFSFTSLTESTPGFIFVCHNKEDLTFCRAELWETEVKSSSCVALLICGSASEHGGQSARLRHGTLSVLAHKTPLAVGDNPVGHSLGWPMPSSGC